LDGNREAFELLVLRYQDALYRHAVRMTGQADEAIDIVQGSLLKGYESLANCHDAERVGAWLFRINANRCKDYLKNRRRRDLRLHEAASIESESGDPQDSAERSELKDQIEEALGRLSYEEREAFVLKHIEGLSYQEMSAGLGASIPALKMRVHRAREELQILLEEYR
jgi:RNA polymerase sigma-70 factor (ECF subfamily)